MDLKVLLYVYSLIALWKLSCITCGWYVWERKCLWFESSQLSFDCDRLLYLDDFVADLSLNAMLWSGPPPSPFRPIAVSCDVFLCLHKQKMQGTTEGEKKRERIFAINNMLTQLTCTIYKIVRSNIWIENLFIYKCKYSFCHDKQK